MNRTYIVSALCIAVLIAAAMLWVGTARYYPMVRATLPDRTKLIFIDLPWTDREKCRDANVRVHASLRNNCPQCRVADSCDSTLDVAWKQALAGQPTRDFVVHSGSMRIVVKAGAASKQTCTEMAEQISRAKQQPARCVFLQ